MIGCVVGSAALPGRCGQGGADRGHQAGVGVAGDQRDPGQAAGDQVAEERQPAGPVLGGGDLDAQDLSVALGVDAVAIKVCTPTTRPASRTLSTRASAARKVYGPASSGRVRNASTASSSSLAMIDTCDLESLDWTPVPTG